MNDDIYVKFQHAKKNSDLKLMETLNRQNPLDLQIKFEYGKLLINKHKVEEGKAIILSLLNTKNQNYAILELGKLEKKQGNTDLAKQYFRKLLNTPNECYAIFEMAKIEKEIGNIEQARIYLKNLLCSKNRNYAMLELGKIEKEEGNLKLARYYFERLINTKIKNCALSELGRLEFEDGNSNLARKYFQELLNTEQKHDKEYAISLLLLLEINEKNYEKAFEYIIVAEKEKLHIRPNFLIYISKMLNVFLNYDYGKDKYNYTIKQFLDYDEFANIEYICENQITGNLNIDIDVNLGQLFSKIKNSLIEEYKLKKLIFNNSFLIPYSLLGLSGNKYIFVATVPNTKQIITMYTVNDRKNTEKQLYELENEKVLKK